MAYGGGYFGSTYYGGTSGGKVTVVTSVTASVAAKGTLTKTLTASVAAAVVLSLSVTASVAAQAQTTQQVTASVAAQAQSTRSVTASVAAAVQYVKSLTASVRAVDETALSVTASVVGYLIAVDYAQIPVGALRATLLNSAGTVIGSGPLLTLSGLSVTHPVDAIGRLTFEAAATDPAVANLLNDYHVRLYHKDAGYLGEGIIRQISTDAAGMKLSVECDALISELVDFNCLLRRKYNNIAVTTVLSTSLVSGSLYGLLYGTGWTAGAIDGGLGNVVVEFSGETIYEAIGALAKRLGKHFRESASTPRALDFGAFGADGGYRLIKPELVTSDMAAGTLGIIESLSIESESSEVIKRLIPLGAGQGLAQLTLEKCTLSSPYTVGTGTNPDGSSYWYIEDAASTSVRTALLVKSDITPLSNSDADTAAAADALYTVAQNYLSRHNANHVTYRASVRNCPTGVREGDKVRVSFRGVVQVRGAAYRWVNIESLLWVMDRTERFDANGSRSVELTLATIDERALDDAGVLIGMMREIQIGTTHVQPYPSESPDTFEEEIDPTHSVTVYIDIDNRILAVNSCFLNIVTKPLRATFSTAASGGGATTSSGGGQTSSSGGAATVTSIVGGGLTSAAGGAQTSGQNSTAHLHNLNYHINQGGATTDNTTDNHSHSVADHTHFTNNHSHDTNLPNHTHTVADHTHSVGNHTHSLTFGVTDDTHYPQVISISIDGVDRTTALGGTWAASDAAISVDLDITTYLVNAAGGMRQKHAIVFSCTTGQGKIRVKSKTLTQVQAIAVTL